MLTLSDLGHRSLRDDACLATSFRAAALLACSAVPAASNILMEIRLSDEHICAPAAQTCSLHDQILGAFGRGATGSCFGLKVGGGHEGENHCPSGTLCPGQKQPLRMVIPYPISLDERCPLAGYIFNGLRQPWRSRNKVRALLLRMTRSDSVGEFIRYACHLADPEPLVMYRCLSCFLFPPVDDGPTLEIE